MYNKLYCRLGFTFGCLICLSALLLICRAYYFAQTNMHYLTVEKFNSQLPIGAQEHDLWGGGGAIFVYWKNTRSGLSWVFVLRYSIRKNMY